MKCLQHWLEQLLSGVHGCGGHCELHSAHTGLSYHIHPHQWTSKMQHALFSTGRLTDGQSADVAASCVASQAGGRHRCHL